MRLNFNQPTTRTSEEERRTTSSEKEVWGKLRISYKIPTKLIICLFGRNCNDLISTPMSKNK